MITLPKARVRLIFPGSSEPTFLALSGARITVGRTPENTVQIIDRTLSSRHAELVAEGDHFRLRDLGSTNGVFVNGQAVTDYHLRESCKVGFGSVECEFLTGEADEGASEELETLPTRAEVTAVRGQNAKLGAELTTLREEIAMLRQASKGEGAEGASVPRAEFDAMCVERTALRERELKLKQDVERLRHKLALLQRDRENLQRALDSSKVKQELEGKDELATTVRLAAFSAPRPIVASPPAPLTAVAAPSEDPVGGDEMATTIRLTAYSAPRAVSAPKLASPTAVPAPTLARPRVGIPATARPSAPAFRPGALRPTAATPVANPASVPPPSSIATSMKAPVTPRSPVPRSPSLQPRAVRVPSKDVQARSLSGDTQKL